MEAVTSPPASDTKDNPLLTAALGYAARGWPVFPVRGISDGQCTCGNSKCASPGKHPHTKNGLDAATTDKGTIRAWWAKWPDANIGLPTGEFFDVLDIDTQEAASEFAEKCLRAGVDLASLSRSITGGGGRLCVVAEEATAAAEAVSEPQRWSFSNR